MLIGLNLTNGNEPTRLEAQIRLVSLVSGRHPKSLLLTS